MHVRPARALDMSRSLFIGALLLLTLGFCGNTWAQPFVAPGRPELRSDLQLLADKGILPEPMTAWPLAWVDVIEGIEAVGIGPLDAMTVDALEQIRTEASIARVTDRLLPHIRLAFTNDPPAIRSYSDVPRQKAELEFGVRWTGERLTFNLDLTRASDAEEDWRLDGSYIGYAAGNWALIAGYPERWWGPGLDGSLILSTNARPLPQVGIQRVSAQPFGPRWLRWIGPWTLATFVGQFDDMRVINDALLFGLRVTAKPLPNLEIGLSRAAQLCGGDRPCDASTFLRMLTGKDNRGINVDDAAEPGNQLGGLDLRWVFGDRPYAVYGQWIGEDSRQGGPQIGSWLRLAGVEYWSALRRPDWRQRTYVELADTICQEGGGGFGGNKFNCAYEHSVYRSGYRYERRSLGHSIDSDSKSIAIATIINAPDGKYWRIGGRHVDINEGPVVNSPHGIATVPTRYSALEVAHGRKLPLGDLRVRLDLVKQVEQATQASSTDTSLSIEWLIGYW